MKISESNTWEVKIYIGGKKDYSGPQFSEEVVTDKIIEFQKENNEKLNIRLTTCAFISGPWKESGWEIVITNFPESKRTNFDIDKIAYDLAVYLMSKLEQKRVTIVSFWKTKVLDGDKK